MTDSTNPIGEKEIREIMQQELIDRVQLLQRKTSSAGLRLQVPGTETFIFAGSAAWIAKNLPDASTTPIASPVSAEQPGASKITDTASARAYVDAWHRKHFLTDRTFSRYIMADPARSTPLAGDFAWQLAKALESMEAPYLAIQSQAGPDGWIAPAYITGELTSVAFKDIETARAICAEGEPIAFYLTPLGIEAQAERSGINLHNAIMNLLCKRTMSHFATAHEMRAYKEGHRDARHAAAELAIAAPVAQATPATPDATPPNSEVLADEAALYRDLTGAAMKLGYDGIPAALEALRGVVAQEGETKGGSA